ncbi:5-oxoprolinase subunit PxpA [uncultured Algimonas sp.]|uniref:LamB/YcsF family protein n=1 Tax=uncultured Algimonas sp. TaxID=1547920 RepID=UPI002632C2D4|nr:5-oxoprolinase subunit PxpA [uncultured Algimonas sp.]
MKTIDLNADIGEADTPEWAAAEAAILRHISSANIACGGHAGDDETMRRTVRGALENGVAIGAHPAYPDRENFGRRSLVLDEDIAEDDLVQSIRAQIMRLWEIAEEEGGRIAYVKPHGQLYNDAVGDRRKADLIARTIAETDPGLILLGGPNSRMGEAAAAQGLAFVAEGFIDRLYSDDGHLVPRGQPGAVIADADARLDQARRLATTGEVRTVSGRMLDIEARSLCVHGDSAGAVETARQARAAIEAEGVTIEAFSTGDATA